MLMNMHTVTWSNEYAFFSMRVNVKDGPLKGMRMPGCHGSGMLMNMYGLMNMHVCKV